jgi:hypothetical protein
VGSLLAGGAAAAVYQGRYHGAQVGAAGWCQLLVVVVVEGTGAPYTDKITWSLWCCCCAPHA